MFKGNLKDVIFRKTGIPKSKQLLTGWRQSPDDDHDILQKFADTSIPNILCVQESKIMSFRNTSFNDGMKFLYMSLLLL